MADEKPEQTCMEEMLAQSEKVEKLGEEFKAEIYKLILMCRKCDVCLSEADKKTRIL